MIQKLRLEKWLTINLKRGGMGVSIFIVEIWPHILWLISLLLFKKFRLAKWLTIKFTKGGVSLFNVKIWSPYIYINFTYRDWKVKTGEMA